jgi:hypothetical protein
MCKNVESYKKWSFAKIKGSLTGSLSPQAYIRENQILRLENAAKAQCSARSEITIKLFVDLVVKQSSRRE